MKYKEISPNSEQFLRLTQQLIYQDKDCFKSILLSCNVKYCVEVYMLQLYNFYNILGIFRNILLNAYIAH